jgi:hypothetical protein
VIVSAAAERVPRMKQGCRGKDRRVRTWLFGREYAHRSVGGWKARCWGIDAGLHSRAVGKTGHELRSERPEDFRTQPAGVQDPDDL